MILWPRADAAEMERTTASGGPRGADKTTNALCVSFSNATLRSVEDEGGSGQSRGSRAAQMGAPVSSQQKSGEGQR